MGTLRPYSIARTGWTVIDLDQPAQTRTTDSGWRRLASVRMLVLIVAGSLLTGVVLGGVAMNLWRYKPLAESVEAEKSAVSVLLFPASGVTTMQNAQGRVRIEAQVTVVNAGPEPVSVRSVRVEQPGVTVRSPERERQIASGTALPVDVVVEWDCVTDQPDALVASVSVETVDEEVRTISPVALDGTPWIESRRRGCASMG